MVELASIIAGEPFSDRPRCVDPVIGAFLRGWNDRAGHADRQLLRPYAQRIVGSRGDRRLTRQRREICLAWATEQTGLGLRGRLGRLWLRLRIAVHFGLRAAIRLNEGAGEYAARVAFSYREHAGAFALLELLLGEPERAASEGPAPAPGDDSAAGRDAITLPPRHGGRSRSRPGSRSASALAGERGRARLKRGSRERHPV